VDGDVREAVQQAGVSSSRPHVAILGVTTMAVADLHVMFIVRLDSHSPA